MSDLLRTWVRPQLCFWLLLVLRQGSSHRKLQTPPVSRMHVCDSYLSPAFSFHIRFVYSSADDKIFGQLAKCPDSKKHPHAARWFRHIQSWKDGGDGSAVAKKGEGHSLRKCGGILVIKNLNIREMVLHEPQVQVRDGITVKCFSQFALQVT